MRGVVVMDIAVSAEENVYPMIPPGAGLKEMVLHPSRNSNTVRATSDLR